MTHFTYHCTWDRVVPHAERIEGCYGPSWRNYATIIPHDHDDWAPNTDRLIHDPLYRASVYFVLQAIREMCKLVNL